MSEVILVVTLIARAGKEAEGEEFLSALVAPTHAEPGCLLYALHRAIDDPQRIVFVERWESRELLETHMASAHIQQAIKDVGSYFSDGPEIVVYEAIPGGQPDKGSIAGHAAGVTI